MRKLLFLATFFLVVHAPLAVATDTTGAGSSFVNPAMAKWADSYYKSTGNKINYQSIGSGAGIAQVKGGTVDFGASDKPLMSDELAKNAMGQFPIVIGGVVPIVNIKGIKSGELHFSGSVLASIFMGTITRWNDRAIQGENPKVKLPDAQITVVHRADGSGTTFNWTNYLSKVSPEWKKKVGDGTAVNWPIGVGGKGNEGVAAYVSRLQYSIGYVEYAYVVQNKFTYALIKNAAGNYVKPSAASFQEAAMSADWVHTKDFYLIMTDAPGANAYPVTATVFVLMPKKPVRVEESKAALHFFDWALSKGQNEARALDYVPLPDALVEQVKRYWKQEFGY